ncbi:MAG: hypothetical protein JO110_08990 [Acetobacteraceae bacterium]|nr:hypothetical protein [Acetobacteraceae bacterium]
MNQHSILWIAASGFAVLGLVPIVLNIKQIGLAAFKLQFGKGGITFEGATAAVFLLIAFGCACLAVNGSHSRESAPSLAEADSNAGPNPAEQAGTHPAPGEHTKDSAPLALKAEDTKSDELAIISRRFPTCLALGKMDDDDRQVKQALGTLLKSAEFNIVDCGDPTALVVSFEIENVREPVPFTISGHKGWGTNGYQTAAQIRIKVSRASTNHPLLVSVESGDGEGADRDSAIDDALTKAAHNAAHRLEMFFQK